jgi:hypothetical protein
VADVCGIEILCTLGVKISRLGSADYRVALLKLEDPV